MNDLFADTSFFVAFLNPDDENHGSAAVYMDTHAGQIVTTVWVLLQLGNYLSGGPQRRLFVPFLRRLVRERRVEIVPADNVLFDRGTEFYGRRPDKKWSLTDCISFLVMKDRRMQEALTADHHFEQAGFTILLK